MHTYLCRDDTDQLILLQGEIDITVNGQNLLSSNVIHICVRVHSSCVIASHSGCIRTVGALPYQGVAQELIKGNYWPLNWECKSRLSI